MVFRRFLEEFSGACPLRARARAKAMVRARAKAQSAYAKGRVLRVTHGSGVELTVVGIIYTRMPISSNELAVVRAILIVLYHHRCQAAPGLWNAVRLEPVLDLSIDVVAFPWSMIG